jgi:hypothetical protein
MDLYRAYELLSRLAGGESAPLPMVVLARTMGQTLAAHSTYVSTLGVTRCKSCDEHDQCLTVTAILDQLSVLDDRTY